MIQDEIQGMKKLKTGRKKHREYCKLSSEKNTGQRKKHL
jgi:hypothetical protein